MYYDTSGGLVFVHFLEEIEDTKKWIYRVISKLAHAISKILFILGSYKFLAYLECIKIYAWSFGHSDPDLSSVYMQYGRSYLKKNVNLTQLTHGVLPWENKIILKFHEFIKPLYLLQ